MALLEEFRSAITRGSGNPLFDPILVPLTGRVHILQVQALSPERRPAAVRGLKALADALLGEDPVAAAEAARKRLRDAAVFALNSRSGDNS